MSVSDAASPPPPGVRKYLMVIVTYIACASFHASREAYVAVKAEFQRRLHFPTQLLGFLDTTFLVAYGVSLLFSGSIGARFGNKRVAMAGLAGTAGIIAIFGAFAAGVFCPPPSNVDEAWAQGLWIYLPLWAANGVIQSLGFPNLVAVTSGWVDPTQRGLILGLWSTTGAAGDIIGLNAATAVLEGVTRLSGRWSDVFVVVVAYLAAMTALLGLTVEDRTATAAGTRSKPTRSVTNETAPLLGVAGASSKPADGGFRGAFTGLAEACRVPGVLDWSASYFFIKTVTYTILFWMPYYLTLTLDSQSTADNLTVLFDVSMIAGTTALGLVTDSSGGARSPLFVLSYVVGSMPLLFLPALGQSTFHYAAAFATVGVFSGGPRTCTHDGGERDSAKRPATAWTTGARVESQRTRRRHRYPRCRARPDDRRARRERGRTRARSEAGWTNSAYPADPSAANAARVSRGNVAEDAASGFTDATFDPPAGSYGGDRDDVSVFAAADLEWDAALPLYVETAEHHAGGVRKGLAALVSDFASGMGFLGNGVGDGDGGVANVNGGGVANVHGDGVASLGSSVSDGASGDEARVDGGFQTRWSRVFLMLFAFNLLAAGTLLRVAAWELRRTRGRETKEGASRPRRARERATPSRGRTPPSFNTRRRRLKSYRMAGRRSSYNQSTRYAPVRSSSRRTSRARVTRASLSHFDDDDGVIEPARRAHGSRRVPQSDHRRRFPVIHLSVPDP